MTPEEVLNQYMPCILDKNFSAAEKKNFILLAMKIYAESEAKAYAHWIANQVIAGRTSHKLWSDYQAVYNQQKL